MKSLSPKSTSLSYYEQAHKEMLVTGLFKILKNLYQVWKKEYFLIEQE